jgi:hypothetical protein
MLLCGGFHMEGMHLGDPAMARMAYRGIFGTMISFPGIGKTACDPVSFPHNLDLTKI